MKCSPKTKQWRNHSGELLDSVTDFDVIECETCAFKHIVPIPSAEELESVYRHEYYAEEKPLYIERHREDAEWWNLVYRDRYDFFEEFLPSDRRHILDVGAGPGFFLLHGKKRDWRTLGIEPATEAAAHSREMGLEIVEEFLTDVTAKKLDRFDVLHMNEVLEHIPDPAGMLRLAYDLLSSGGLICVVVPNDYNPFQLALRAACDYSPWWLAPPHHINYFCFESLQRLLQSAGFEVVRSTATFPMDAFLLMGKNYVGSDRIGRRVHGMRKAFELNLASARAEGLLANLYSALAERGLGRECVVIARKC